MKKDNIFDGLRGPYSVFRCIIRVMAQRETQRAVKSVSHSDHLLVVREFDRWSMTMSVSMMDIIMQKTLMIAMMMMMMRWSFVQSIVQSGDRLLTLRSVWRRVWTTDCSRSNSGLQQVTSGNRMRRGREWLTGCSADKERTLRRPASQPVSPSVRQQSISAME